jgi:hypothetical protein
MTRRLTRRTEKATNMECEEIRLDVRDQDTAGPIRRDGGGQFTLRVFLIDADDRISDGLPDLFPGSSAPQFE